MKRERQLKMRGPGLSFISKVHYGKLALRAALFLAAGIVYLVDRAGVDSSILGHFGNGVWVLGLVWLLFIAEMVLRMLPSHTESMGCQKQFSKNYRPTGLPPHKPKGQTGAVAAIVGVWLLLNGAIGALYLTHIIDAGILMLVSLAYAVCDMICILLFCPFQVWFLKNKCCNTCRIYNWDFAMMFTPLVFIPSWYTWSLLAMALLLLARWELTLHRHPERFYEYSNDSLACAVCQEKLCNQKKSVDRIRLKILRELKEELDELKDELLGKDRTGRK